MARAIWSGSISFGLVNVPVKAFTAVRDHSVHFNQLEKGTGARIKHQNVSSETGDVVEGDEIELGYEIRKGRYVTFERDELEELKPESTRAIEVADFVPLDDIDPIYYERTYWLGPADDTAGQAYQLLLAAMEDRGRVGIGTVVMRNKQYLAAIRPLDGVLAMSTMRFADEVVPQADVDELPSRRSKPDPKAVRMATQIIDSLETEWQPERYHDTFTEELEAVIERKDKGEEAIVEEAPAQQAKVLDLMAALEASVSAAKSARKGKVAVALASAAAALVEDEDDDAEQGTAAGKKAATKKAATKKTATKKTATTKAGAKKAGSTKAPTKSTGAKKAGAKKAGTKRPAATKAARRSA